MGSRQLTVASKNQGKLKEFKRILEPLGFAVQSMAEAGITEDIIEDGKTFADNAVIKAMAIHRLTGGYAIADDSGLCIDALDGAPGVYSARFLGEDTPYTIKNAKVIEMLKDISPKNRTARFVSAIAYVTEDGECQVYEGVCEGYIGYEARGERGFGYDPIFMVGDQSYSELTDAQKDRISHRGKALAAFYQGINAK